MTCKYFYLKTIIVVFLLSAFGCKTKINQIKNQQREGKWITIDTFDYVYIIKGKYHKGIEKGTWKHFYNNKIARKEKYKNGICDTRFYYPNGKIMKQGFTKSESNDTLSHWFYFGNWNYYDQNGNLTKTIIYDEGEVIDSLIIKPI